MRPGHSCGRRRRLDQVRLAREQVAPGVDAWPAVIKIESDFQQNAGCGIGAAPADIGVRQRSGENRAAVDGLQAPALGQHLVDVADDAREIPGRDRLGCPKHEADADKPRAKFGLGRALRLKLRDKRR